MSVHREGDLNGIIRWRYTSEVIPPGESWYDNLRKMGAAGWEAWFLEVKHEGWREIYYKRPDPDL